MQPTQQDIPAKNDPLQPPDHGSLSHYSRSSHKARTHPPDLGSCLLRTQGYNCTTYRTDPVQVRS
uniref:Uncharacterized protein n=1 Tax=Cucumis melo TaxID=3656 RepID=A0A9I9EI96_CUCME